MAGFLVGDDLKAKIEMIMQEEGSRSAVAFWGNGAAKKLNGAGNGEFRIVCNLISGGTNPFEIEKMKRDNVRQCDRLHAKVYLGSETAVVASANVSANGLGLEAVEQALWIEAGYFVTNKIEIGEIEAWFDELWNKAKPISGRDLRSAKGKWKIRQRGRPSALTLKEFDPEREDTPLLYSVGTAREWENNEEVRDLHGLTDDDINTSLEIHSEVDREVLQPGRWVLVWHQRINGIPFRNPRPYWFFIGRQVNNAFRWSDEKNWRDVIVKSDNAPDVPFNLRSPDVLDTFITTLSAPKFEELRREDCEDWFSSERIDLMQAFWRQLHNNEILPHQ